MVQRILAGIRPDALQLQPIWRCREHALMPAFWLDMGQIATDHFLSGRWVPSIIVPAVALNWREHLVHCHLWACPCTLEQVRFPHMGAAISSGSYLTDGMIVAPCSMKSLAAIACAFDDDLLVRAADVCRKEGRKVVLVPRECPLSPAHLRNMLQVTEDGYTVLPPVLSFYNGAKTTDEQVDHIVGKILMQFGLPYDKFHPWEG